MHKININLHNLKTALIFSTEISRGLFVSTWFMYVPNYIIFRRSPAKIWRGVESTPPPPRLWDRVKRPGFFRVKYEFKRTVLCLEQARCHGVHAPPPLFFFLLVSSVGSHVHVDTCNTPTPIFIFCRKSGKNVVEPPAPLQLISFFRFCATFEAGGSSCKAFCSPPPPPSPPSKLPGATHGWGTEFYTILSTWVTCGYSKNDGWQSL